MKGYADIHAIINRAENDIFRIPRVHALCAGIKTTFGTPTGVPCIVVYVIEKLAPELLTSNDVVPARILGVSTDIVELPPIVPIGDETEYRPLVGGCKIQAGNFPWAGRLPGTMGCLAKTTEEVMGYAKGTLVGLTNHHVVSTDPDDKPEGSEVGQPDYCSICCVCCSEKMGRVIAAVRSELVDAAIIAIDPDISGVGTAPVGEYRAEIVLDQKARAAGVPPMIRGIRPRLTTDDLPLSVYKRGKTTGYTEGRIINIGVDVAPTRNGWVLKRMRGQMMIVANPDFPSFGAPGDSGSVVLDQSNQVVGLLHASIRPRQLPGRPPPVIGQVSYATPIQDVLDSLPIRVETAQQAGDVRNVPRLARLAQSGRAAPAGVQLEQAQAMMRAKQEVLETHNGRRLAEVVREHLPELRTLVRTNKRVAATWRSYHGAAIWGLAATAIERRTVQIPSSVENRSVQDCVKHILATFSKYGSSELRAEVARLTPLASRLTDVTYEGVLTEFQDLRG